MSYLISCGGSASTDLPEVVEGFDALRNWVSVGQLTLTNKTLTAPTINGITGVLDINTGTAIASAGTINLNTATGNRVHITGTTTITAVTLTRGPRTVIFDGILTLTHNATTNNLPGAANITTAAGDRAIYESDGTTVYCVSYIKATGAAVVVSPASEFTFTTSKAVSAAGKALVINSAGLVKESTIAAASVGTVSTFNASETNACSVTYDPVAAVYAIFYRDVLSANKGKVILATVATNNTISYGTATVFDSDVDGSGQVNIGSCYDPVTAQIIVAYSRVADGFARLITAKITGAAITFGTSASTGVSSWGPIGVCYDTSVNRALVSLRDSNDTMKCIVATVSGTSITFGTPLTTVASGSNGYTAAVVHCGSLATNAMTYNTSGRGYIKQIKIDPTTFVPSVSGNYGVESYNSGYGPFAGNACLVWIESLARLAAIFGSNGTSGVDGLYGMLMSNGTSGYFVHAASVAIDSASGWGGAPYQHYLSISYSAASGALCIAYPDINASYVGKISFSAIPTASTLSFGAKTTWQSSATDMTFLCANNSNYQVLAGAFDNPNPLPSAAINGTAVAATAPVVDERTQFIGFSTAPAIQGGPVAVTLPFGTNTSQSGLTPNTLYYLSSTNGTTLTTTVSGPAVARALSATAILVLGTNTFP